jgi:dCMP deaminase
MAFDKWDRRFMQMCDLIGTWASCYKSDRKMGCVIVKDKRVLTTGYNGAPAGLKTCVERGECMRVRLGIPSGQQAQLCYAVHAEQNALIQAAKLGLSVDGATLYVTYRPCVICAKLIINAGIRRIVYRYDYPDDFALELLNEAGVILEQYDQAD